MLAALVAAQRAASAERVVAADAWPRRVSHRERHRSNRRTRRFPSAELAQFYGATETSSIVTCLRNEEAAIGTRVARLVRAGGPGRRREDRARRRERGRARRGRRDTGPGPQRHARLLGKPRGDGRRARGRLVPQRRRRRPAGAATTCSSSTALKDMIVSGAENVYSIEVEDVLHRHPAVVEAAVFGIPDDTSGARRSTRSSSSQAEPSGGREQLAAELRDHCRSAHRRLQGAQESRDSDSSRSRSRGPARS